MASVKLKLNKERRLKNGLYPLVFQILHNRKKRLCYTSFHLHEDEFSESKGKAVWVDNAYHIKSEIGTINKALKSEKIRLLEIISNLDNKFTQYQIDNITELFTMSNSDGHLLTYIDTCIDIKLKNGKVGSAATYRKTKISVERFLEGSDIRFSQITSELIHKYELFLQSSNISANTICYYMRNLKSICNQAVFSGFKLDSSHPFKYIHTRPRKTIKRALDKDKLKSLLDLELYDSNLIFSRDLFMFSFYTRGMSFVDISFLKKSDILDNTIRYNRRKTGFHISISITTQLQNIINRYSNSSKYIFPIIKSENLIDAYKEYQTVLRRVNRNLKVLARMADIQMPLTTYVSRHSWATQARRCGAPISIISEGLGHASENITGIYLKQFDQSDLDKINDLVSELI